MSEDGFNSFVDIVRQHSEDIGDKVAYTFLEGNKETSITFKEVDEKAKQIGVVLEQNLSKGSRVLLLYPPGLEYICAFYGCMYGGMVAVPAYPPSPTSLDRNIVRLLALVRDAEACSVLTTAPIMSMSKQIRENVEEFQRSLWIATDQLTNDSDMWINPNHSKDSLAFIQYTSGSTGNPKGVMLSHGNLIHNSHAIASYACHESDAHIASWLPPYHDMGLIGAIMHPMHYGLTSSLMSPMDFLKKPLLWLKLISRHKATISPSPNFGYDLCVKKIKEENLKELDLSSFRTALNGAEPIREETLSRFANKFSSVGFKKEALFPCYGLAEGTLMVSGAYVGSDAGILHLDPKKLESNVVVETDKDTERSNSFIGSGEGIKDQVITIVNIKTQSVCQEGGVGEIWVSGPSVALGYWNKTELTEATFEATLESYPDKKFLRTGDLGFHKNGQLFITGRLKDLIIINGKNFYPQDIEYSAECTTDSIRGGCSAAFSIEVDNQEKLVLVSEATVNDNKLEEISNKIIQSVAKDCGVSLYDIVLIEPRTIPKTSSGKIQRNATKLAYLNNELEVNYCESLKALA